MSAVASKVALVTGARQGIGRVIARRLATDGARVAVNDTAPDARLEAVSDECGGMAAAADVSSSTEVERAILRVEERLGAIDLVVCNAAYASMGPFIGRDDADWWRNLDVNLTGTFNVVRATAPSMRRRRQGSIVVISSEWGVRGWPNATAYAASKAGLLGLVSALADELREDEIRVNAVAPGVVDTDQLLVDAEEAGVTREEIVARYAAETPLGKVGDPTEIAATVAFLASSNGMTGKVLQPNGGTTTCGPCW